MTKPSRPDQSLVTNRFSSSMRSKLSTSSVSLSRKWQYVLTNFMTLSFPNRFRNLVWTSPNEENARSNPEKKKIFELGKLVMPYDT